MTEGRLLSLVLAQKKLTFLIRKLSDHGLNILEILDVASMLICYGLIQFFDL